MIVPMLKGGLCNQMFQIAAGYALSLKMKCPFGINYNLPHHCIQGYHPSKYRDTVYRNIPTTEEIPKVKYSEPRFNYNPLPETDELLYDGYFQSEKYFADCKDDIRRLFTFPEELCSNIKTTFSILKHPVVGVAVRLGDYLKYVDVFGTLELDYYERAKLHICVDDATYILVTDDANGATKKLGKALFSPLMWCNSGNEIKDLYALTLCDSIIMANSSFSWWGAWLGNEKTVVCPKTWFGPKGYHPHDDIYCKNWIRI